ncbi:MAG: hypothetical protein GC147_08895 [Porphyrobacter sp.]|nr:hypothetical protein [Porphyrobacter sp.]
MIRQLSGQAVEKVWGRRDAPAIPGIARTPGAPLGEVWFAHEAAPALMVKFLYTSEKLSIQVHPDDALARASGHPRGKEEAWYVLTAEPGATIGAGFSRELSEEDLRAAALDGSIVDLMVWHPVKPGDFFYVPAGTVHAIGAGLSLVEIQQNVDLTYRLYDYGRPRPLQLDESIAAATPAPFKRAPAKRLGPGREQLVTAPHFAIERLSRPGDHQVAGSAADPAWLVPVAPGCQAGGTSLEPGTVWLADSAVDIAIAEGGALLVAHASGHPACAQERE